MGKRVLVTGGAGFVGSHTVDALLAEGHAVTIFDNLTEQVHHGAFPACLARDAEFVRGDVRDAEAMRKIVRGKDVIYHLAAAVGVGQSMYEIANYMGANTQGTAVLLQSLIDTKAQIEKLIVASSMSIYGEGLYRCDRCNQNEVPPPRPTSQLLAKKWELVCPSCGSELQPVPTEESKPLQYTSFYSLSKKDQEEMVLLFGRTYNTPVVALRYFNIFGTRQALSNPYTGVAAIFASRLLNQREPLVFEDGQQLRDFVSVHDVVQANLLALKESKADGNPINVGGGRPISILDIARILSKELGVDVQPKVTGEFRAGDVRHCYANIDRAQKLLRYEPKVTFAQGMSELVDWLRSQSAVDHASEALKELKAHRLVA